MGALARIAYETVREMMAAAVDQLDARPGIVGVLQTFGSSLKWNSHIHAIVTRDRRAERALLGALRDPRLRAGVQAYRMIRVLYRNLTE